MHWEEYWSASRRVDLTFAVGRHVGQLIAVKNGSRGLAGRIIGYGYHGHDSVVTVQPEPEPDLPAIVVRTLGGCKLPAGSPVTLQARGPVLAWPR